MSPDVNNPSREPTDYGPSDHFLKMKRERNIGWHEIQEAIKEGENHPELANESWQTVFVLRMPVDLYVVMDLEDMTGVTTYHDDDQGAEHGKL